MSGADFFLSVLKKRRKNVRCKVKGDIRHTAEAGVNCTRPKTVGIKVEKRQFSALKASEISVRNDYLSHTINSP